MKKLLKYLLIFVGIVLMILLFTNPSPDDFKSYLYATQEKKKVETAHYGRTHNYLLWSVYSMTEEKYIENQSSPFQNETPVEHYVDWGTSNYYGFMKNFFAIHYDFVEDSVELPNDVNQAMQVFDSVRPMLPDTIHSK